jgi:hypothetical protein
MPTMTVAEYAAHRGVLPLVVTLAVQNGRIQASDGLIDQESADAVWGGGGASKGSLATAAAQPASKVEKRTRRHASMARIGPRTPGAPHGIPKPVEPTAAGEPTLEQEAALERMQQAGVGSLSAEEAAQLYPVARTMREYQVAKLREVETRKKMGEVVDREFVAKSIDKAFVTLRDALMGIPDRVSAILAAETDEFKVGRALRDELVSVLNGFDLKI